MQKLLAAILSSSLFLLPMPAAAVEKIAISGLFKDKAIVEIDGKRRVLSKDKPSPEGVILKQANSESAILEINGVRKEYTLGSHVGGNFSTAKDKNIVTIAPDSQNSYFVNGSINGFQVRFLVDTGATLISMNRNVAKRLGIPYRLEGQKGQSSTASGINEIYIVNLKRVKVGDIMLRNIQAAINEGDFPLVILLGNSFLSRVNMQRQGRIMQLSN